LTGKGGRGEEGTPDCAWHVFRRKEITQQLEVQKPKGNWGGGKKGRSPVAKNPAPHRGRKKFAARSEPSNTEGRDQRNRRRMPTIICHHYHAIVRGGRVGFKSGGSGGKNGSKRRSWGGGTKGRWLRPASKREAPTDSRRISECPEENEKASSPGQEEKTRQAGGRQSSRFGKGKRIAKFRGSSNGKTPWGNVAGEKLVANRTRACREIDAKKTRFPNSKKAWDGGEPETGPETRKKGGG